MLLARAREVERLRDHRRRCFADVAPVIHEPGFDMLLLVYRASLEGVPATVSMARSAAGLPESVGARWIDVLDQADLLIRTYDPERVQMHLTLSPRGEAMMVRYLEDLPL
jgi:hypothetical protein